MIVYSCICAILASRMALCIGSVRSEEDNDLLQPLFLTPLIEEGQLEIAREKSLVLPLPESPSDGVGRSYSGFLTTNKKYNNNLFFWYFPAQVAKPAGVPVLLWLQGGPGTSSLLGLFVEHGPIMVTKDMKLKSREYAWTSEFHVVYIDQPVGTGFSFTDFEEGYATDENMVAEDLFQALLQFFTLFPNLQQSDFYITGESYAGKFVPAISLKLHQEKPDMIRFRGLIIGGGWIDPKTSYLYSSYWYQLGLIDENQQRHVTIFENRVRDLISQHNWTDALMTESEIFLYFYDKTGFSQHYNILYNNDPEDHKYYLQYLQKDSVRRSIHVGNLPHSNHYQVIFHLQEDIMKSSVSLLVELMEHYKVLLYYGQFDIIAAYPLTSNFLLSLNWSGAGAFKSASRWIWKVDESDEEVAGYVKRAKDTYQVLIRNAGHMTPYDQPRATLDVISKFVNDRMCPGSDCCEAVSNSAPRSSKMCFILYLSCFSHIFGCLFKREKWSQHLQ